MLLKEIYKSISFIPGILIKGYSKRRKSFKLWYKRFKKDLPERIDYHVFHLKLIFGIGTIRKNLYQFWVVEVYTAFCKSFDNIIFTLTFDRYIWKYESFVSRISRSYTVLDYVVNILDYLLDILNIFVVYLYIFEYRSIINIVNLYDDIVLCIIYIKTFYINIEENIYHIIFDIYQMLIDFYKYFKYLIFAYIDLGYSLDKKFASEVLYKYFDNILKDLELIWVNDFRITWKNNRNVLQGKWNKFKINRSIQSREAKLERKRIERRKWRISKSLYD